MRTMRLMDKLYRGNLYRSIDISASGMRAQRKRMDATSSNIANVSTTNADGAGNPYLRQHVLHLPAPKQKFTTSLREAQVKLSRTKPYHLPASDYSRTLEQTPLVEGENVQIPNMHKKNMITKSLEI